MSKNTSIKLLLAVIAIMTAIIYTQNTKLQAYDNYNKYCEILLDSINANDSSFLDTTGETDEYYNYLMSRQHLDSLLYKY